ncbi:MAG: glycosyltransferase [Candidatus Hydrothermarchaeales archaeon]
MDISVIIPTLNEENFIEACLSSIHSQNTYLNYEVIACDGGSADGTVKIAEEYADKVIVSEIPNVGIQRNLGAGKAKSDHLLFLDADTLLPPNYLEESYKKFEKDEELLGFSAGFMFSERTKRLIFAEKVTNSYFMFRDKIGSPTLPGFNINVRKDAFEKLNGFKDVPLEDVEFSIAMRNLGKTRYFMDFLVITSPRRLEEMGLLGGVRYYIEMELVRRNPSLKDVLLYNEYVSCRIKHSTLQEEFDKVISGRTLSLIIDLPLSKYIRERTDKLSALMQHLTPKEILGDMITTSRSIADIGLRTGVERKDVDRAIKLMKSKALKLKEKALLPTNPLNRRGR